MTNIWFLCNRHAYLALIQVRLSSLERTFRIAAADFYSPDAPPVTQPVVMNIGVGDGGRGARVPLKFGEKYFFQAIIM